VQGPQVPKETLLELQKNGIAFFPDLYFPEVEVLGRRKVSKPFKTKRVVEHPLGDEFLPLAEAYYGKRARVEGELIVTVPTAQPESGSQLWHRDLEAGKKCLRVFIFLTDVDLNNGPLEYAPGTQGEGPRYPEHPIENSLTITGPKGTGVVFDILGYHRGLKNLTGERRVLAFTYKVC
jgi:hypothetical protein